MRFLFILFAFLSTNLFADIVIPQQGRDARYQFLFYVEDGLIQRRLCNIHLIDISRDACSFSVPETTDYTRFKIWLLSNFVGYIQAAESRVSSWTVEVIRISQQIEDMLANEEHLPVLDDLIKELSSLREQLVKLDLKILQLRQEIADLKTHLRDDDNELRRQLLQLESKYLTATNDRLKVVSDLETAQTKIASIRGNILDVSTFDFVVGQRKDVLAKLNIAVKELKEKEARGVAVERVLSLIKNKSNVVFRFPTSNQNFVLENEVADFLLQKIPVLGVISDQGLQQTIAALPGFKLNSTDQTILISPSMYCEEAVTVDCKDDSTQFARQYRSLKGRSIEQYVYRVLEKNNFSFPLEAFKIVAVENFNPRFLKLVEHVGFTNYEVDDGSDGMYFAIWNEFSDFFKSEERFESGRRKVYHTSKPHVFDFKIKYRIETELNL